MKKPVLMFMLFSSVGVFAQPWEPLGLDLGGEGLDDQSGFSVSMPDVHTVAIGAAFNDGNGQDAGHVRVYAWNGSAWVQKGDDLDGQAALDHAGWAVSMPDANTVAVGANGNDGIGTAAGYVKVYAWSNNTWVQKGETIVGEVPGDESGCSVSMPDVNTVAIGAVLNGGSGAEAGHVRVFVWSGSAWEQKGLDLDGEAAYDYSGKAVSMPDANTVAIGANQNDDSGTEAGHVRVYAWSGSTWEQKGLDLDGEGAYDYSGWSVSMPDANTVAIGAISNAGSGAYAGHVRVYAWDGTTWVQRGADLDGETADDYSGWSVSMADANTVAIGSNTHSNANGFSVGQVRVFAWSGSAWMQEGEDMDGDTADDASGYSVSMPDANTVAIGAIGSDYSNPEAGHVRVYSMDPTATIVESELNELQAYPIPTSGALTVELGQARGVVGLVVTNALGQEMHRMRVNTAAGRSTFSLDGPSGAYLVTVVSDDGSLGRVKVLKE